MNISWCNKADRPEREVSCGWKDRNRGACVTHSNEWCPFFEQRPRPLRVLHLTLHRKWFDRIAMGRKKREFREVTEYWVKRLTDANYDPIPFDEIHFRNGYAKGAPWMRVKWLGMTGRAGLFAIKLGEVMETKNWEGPKA